MPEEFPDDGPQGMVTMAVALPVSFDLYFLPYFPAHVAFLEHASGAPATDDTPAVEGCERCHFGAFHPENFPEDAEEEDLFCETGLELRAAARDAILHQHAASMQN